MADFAGIRNHRRADRSVLTTTDTSHVSDWKTLHTLQKEDWFIIAPVYSSWERKNLWEDIAYADLNDAEQTYCVCSLNSLTLEAVRALAESDTASLQWITKCPATWKSRKAQNIALIPTTFNYTTSFLIHKNKFGTSLDGKKIFLHFSVFPHCANVLTN